MQNMTRAKKAVKKCAREIAVRQGYVIPAMRKPRRRAIGAGLQDVEHAERMLRDDIDHEHISLLSQVAASAKR
jgi:hypothetical protein